MTNENSTKKIIAILPPLESFASSSSIDKDKHVQYKRITNELAALTKATFVRHAEKTKEDAVIVIFYGETDSIFSRYYFSITFLFGTNFPFKRPDVKWNDISLPLDMLKIITAVLDKWMGIASELVQLVEEFRKQLTISSYGFETSIQEALQSKLREPLPNIVTQNCTSKLTEVAHPNKSGKFVKAIEVQFCDNYKNPVHGIALEDVDGFVSTADTEVHVPCSVAHAEKGKFYIFLPANANGNINVFIRVYELYLPSLKLSV